MSEHEEWMVLDDQGRQKHIKGYCTPQELLQKLTKGKEKSWEDKFRAAIKEECGGLCVLVCKSCMAVLSANNPSKSLSSHTCTPTALARAAALRASPPASPTTALCNTLSIQTAEKLSYVKANMPSAWLE